jgi:hypothetical protein
MRSATIGGLGLVLPVNEALVLQAWHESLA